MSADEDTELRDLVAQTLEANGVLGKIKAELRASVFLALEEQESVKNKTPFLNQELRRFGSTAEGRQVVGLVREFLQFFSLDYTLAVFEPESGFDEFYESRSRLAKDLKLPESVESSKVPLITELVRHVGRSPNAANKWAESSVGGLDREFVLNKNLSNAAQPHHDTPTGRKDVVLSDDDDDQSDDDERLHGNAKDKKEAVKEPAVVKNVNNTSASSLAGLPSLSLSTKAKPKEDDTDVLFQKPSKSLVDFDYNEDKYEDDFNRSDITPYPTPRSPKSDQNVASIQDEIEEDPSIQEDIFKSDPSINEDLTTDRTVSPVDQSAFDYAEDVLHP